MERLSEKSIHPTIHRLRQEKQVSLSRCCRLFGISRQAIYQVFVSDITYVKSRERTHYLSLVTDAFSRKIMGYHLSNEMSAQQVEKGLKMAIKKRQTKKPLIHHSERGLQYCSAHYQNTLNKNNIQPSMTDGYDCYQNALAERINGILKQEFLVEKCNTGAELEILIRESIETYNSKRPHLSLKMKTSNFVRKKNGSTDVLPS